MKSRISKKNFSWPGGLTEETLRNERIFLNYVRLLKSFAQKYCVIIAVNNTPCSDAVTQDISKEIMDIGGLKINLYNKHNYPYIAVIDEGTLLCEKTDPSTLNVIKKHITLDGTNDSIDIISAGGNAPNGNKGIIKINGINYSPDVYGFNFVVYDKFSKKVIDSVAFNAIKLNRTLSGKINISFSTESKVSAASLDNVNRAAQMRSCRRPANTYDILEKYMRAHPGVIVLEYRIPLFPTSNLTEYEKFVKDNDVRFKDVTANFEKHLYEISRYYNDEAAKEVLTVRKSYEDNSGARRFEDVQEKYVNIAGGHRVTCYQPVQDSETITIFMHGPCQAFGIGVSDEHTIASHLQKIVNEFAPQYKIIVQNYGFFMDNQRSEDEHLGTDSWIFKTLNSLPAKPGDIVMYYNECFIDNNMLPQIDLRNAAYAPRDYEIFFDHVHFTPDGTKLIAEKLYEGLADQGIFDRALGLVSERRNADRAVSSLSEFDQNTNEYLAEYKKFLTDFYNTALNQPTGVIVMNCNPFTLGHRYLIDKALEQCSYLIVFLVEEDKSEFSFEERLTLADEGTKDIPNLAIIPSGKFILSSLTFSEYFDKSEMQDRIIDTSLDLTVFAREIAPCLNITKRFAGEEPLDNVTKQYNDAMRRILPEYGIEFVEIPRIELDSKPISASRVRELAKNGRFSELEGLVPQTTLDYLIAKYKS